MSNASLSLDLWGADDTAPWSAALGRYAEVVEAQGVNRLVELDTWYREDLPLVLAARQPQSLSYDELVKVTEWKMKRGVWRPRNLVLVKSNDAAEVEQISRDAFARIPDRSGPITVLVKLAGVGPATASAVVSAAAPDVYPFFDELVAAQIPDLGPVDFNAKYYARYADALRARASRLGANWTPTLVERALWSSSGGKIKKG